MKANQRRRRNNIDKIQDSTGQLHYDAENIEGAFLDYFKQLFTSQNPTNVEHTVQSVQNKLTEDMKNYLNQPFTPEEILLTIKGMKSLAAPGPDGLPTKFYQHYWPIIGNDITNMCLDILNNDGDPSCFNHTNISLIPKNKSPNTPKDFRPIALCNVTLQNSYQNYSQ